MATIVTRAGKGSPLTHEEVDANFTNLNDEAATKAPLANPVFTGDLTIADKIVHSGDTNTSIRFPAADTVTVETSGAERLRVDSVGFVGIGASAPIAQLHVATNASGMGLIAGSGVRQLVESSGPAAIQIASGGTTNPAYIFMGLNGDPDATRIASQVGFTQISATGASNYLRFDTGGLNERMRITGAGNVGIGTSSPVQKLQVNVGSGGALFQNGPDPAAGVAHPYVTAPVATGHSTAPAYGFWYQLAGMSNPAGNTLGFVTNNVERIRITNTGNVGIGTASPTATLDVAGTGAMKVPVGTDAQRPTSATGLLRFNTDAASFEGYNGTEWGSIGGGATSDAVYENSAIIAENITIVTGRNGMSTGPITVNSGVTVTVESGARYVVI